MWEAGDRLPEEATKIIEGAKVQPATRENVKFNLICFTCSYDAMYIDKEGKRHVVRLSQPGYETHWFSTDAKDKADKWVEVTNFNSSVKLTDRDLFW